MSEEIKHIRFPKDAKSRREECSRVLTMKYGKQQMMLIRKRMKIENWIDAEVAKLFNGNEDNGVDIDLDTLLNLGTVPAKRKFVFDHLQRSHCPASMDKITVFLDEMIDQLNNYNEPPV